METDKSHVTSLMWDITEKAINRQTKQTYKETNLQTQAVGGEGEGGEGVEPRVREGDQTAGGGHGTEYTEDALQSCSPELDVMLVIKVTPPNLIKIES